MEKQGGTPFSTKLGLQRIDGSGDKKMLAPVSKVVATENAGIGPVNSAALARQGFAAPS